MKFLSVVFLALLFIVSGCGVTTNDPGDNTVAVNPDGGHANTSTAAPERTDAGEPSSPSNGSSRSSNEGGSGTQPIVVDDSTSHPASGDSGHVPSVVDSDASGVGSQQNQKQSQTQTKPLPKDIPDSDVVINGSDQGQKQAQAQQPQPAVPPQPTKQKQQQQQQQGQVQTKKQGNGGGPESTDVFKGLPDEIVAIGSSSTDASKFLDQGPHQALNEARSCLSSGHFIDGSECYMVFGDGHFDWVNSRNRKELKPFVSSLQKLVKASRKRSGS